MAGSIRVARRAGTYPATTATSASTASAPAYVMGSDAPTPNNRPRMARLAIHEAGMPTTTGPEGAAELSRVGPPPIGKISTWREYFDSANLA